MGLIRTMVRGTMRGTTNDYGGSMSEIDQLKKRIDKSGPHGVKTAHIRDDYEPAGDMMIMHLTDSGEYVQRKIPAYVSKAEWAIFKQGFQPY